MSTRLLCEVNTAHHFHYHGSLRQEECLKAYGNKIVGENMKRSSRGAHKLAGLIGMPDVDKPGYLGSIAPIADFYLQADKNNISVTEHPDPEVPYLILNYTPQAMYAHDWNDVTVNSRGLIINGETGEVVSRGFSKFFNYGQLQPEEIKAKMSGPVTVTDKMDGSLGILYKLPNGEYAVATRGSMDSHMAREATKIYHEKYADFRPKDDYTYMFEIIYPENRIVLDYGDKRDIVLLAAQHNKSLETEDIRETQKYWPGETTEILPYSSLDEALKAEIPENKEGVVLYFHDTKERVKLKGETYLAMHKTKFGLTRKNVIENIYNLKDPNEFKAWASSLPDEFYPEVSRFVKELDQVKKGILIEAADAAKRIVSEHKGDLKAQHNAASKTSFPAVTTIFWVGKRNNWDAAEINSRVNRYFETKLKPGGSLAHLLPEFDTKLIMPKNDEDF